MIKRKVSLCSWLVHSFLILSLLWVLNSPRYLQILQTGSEACLDPQQACPVIHLQLDLVWCCRQTDKNQDNLVSPHHLCISPCMSCTSFLLLCRKQSSFVDGATKWSSSFLSFFFSIKETKERLFLITSDKRAAMWAESYLNILYLFIFSLRLICLNSTVISNPVEAAVECDHQWQKKVHLDSFFGKENVLCTSDSPWHFLIMVWCPESFSPSHHHSEAQEKCHYSTCHYKSKRKNKIDWRPRGLWITYLSSFISTLAGASVMFHLYKKITAFLTILRNPLWAVEMLSCCVSKK